MPQATMDDFLGENHDELLVAARARMRGDETMGRVAAQRELSATDLVSQVVGFWLQAIRTDLELGSTAAMEQNMGWLVTLRDGHALPFKDEAVMGMFADISAEIEARLDSDLLRSQYADYRGKVEGLIAEAFPEKGGAA